MYFTLHSRANSLLAVSREDSAVGSVLSNNATRVADVLANYSPILSNDASKINFVAPARSPVRMVGRIHFPNAFPVVKVVDSVASAAALRENRSLPVLISVGQLNRLHQAMFTDRI